MIVIRCIDESKLIYLQDNTKKITSPINLESMYGELLIIVRFTKLSPALP